MIIVIIIGVVFYYVWNTKDPRNLGQKIGDAIEEFPNGMDKAARQLEERTPGEKLEDSTGDAVDNVKKSINQQ